MRDDPNTLAMLKEISVRGLRWSLVERATHLVLAVVVGYWIGSNEKSEPEKQMQRVEARAGELLKDRKVSIDGRRDIGGRNN